MKDFLEFIRKQSVVGLAIGFLLGGAVTKLVTSFVQDIINPLIGLLLGKVGNLKNVIITLGSTQIMVGNFLSALLDFVIIAFIVYFIFKKLEKYLDKKD